MRPRKPRKEEEDDQKRETRSKNERLTTDGEFGRSGDELEELSSDGRLVGRHDVDEVSDGSGLDVVSMIRLENLTQSLRRKKEEGQDDAEEKGSESDATKLTLGSPVFLSTSEQNHQL